MAKKRGGAKAKNKPNAAKESKPGHAKEIKPVPAEENEQFSPEGIKHAPEEKSTQGSIEGIKCDPVEKCTQGNTEDIQRGSKGGTKHNSTKSNKRGPAKGKRKPAKGIEREPAEGSVESDNRDSSDENNDVSEEESMPGFVHKIERDWEKALEVFADGIVEVLIFLEKRYKRFQKCIQNINLVTFFLFKSVMQCYFTVHFMHILVYLLDLTGMHFEFPLKDANHSITNFRDYLAWDVKLFVLMVTIIYFINDLVNTGHHGKNHVDGIWIILLAEVEMFLLAPPSDNFGDYLLMALITVTALVTVARLLFEVCYNDSDDLDSSLDFLPLLAFMHLVIFIFNAMLIFLYEASKFLEEFVPDIIFADVIF